MKIVSVHEMVALEKQEIAQREVNEEVLMEQAGAGIACIIQQDFSRVQEATILVGKGNNGGDGLVAARLLAQQGWKVHLVLTSSRESFRELPRKKLQALVECGLEFTLGEYGKPVVFPPAEGVVVDALLGVGARGPLAGELLALVRRVNEAREHLFFRTVAIDGPTGLLSWEEGSEEKGAVPEAIVADTTITIGYCKEPLVREELSGWVGRIRGVSLFQQVPKEGNEVLLGSELASLLPRRSALSHKNTYGRVLLIGGSRGFVGAPVLASHAALRCGAGLVHLAVTSGVYEMTCSQVWPEVMVTTRSCSRVFEKQLHQAKGVGIGPGLGTTREPEIQLQWVLEHSQCPVVVDADALVCLSNHLEWIKQSKVPLILTPHPGEMRRLIGRSFGVKERAEVAREFVETYGVCLVLKGTRTIVASPGKPLFFNTSGNPGLASGGSGDTLTGMLVALLAQGLLPWDAIRLGVWLHGHAADLALDEQEAEEALLPSDVVKKLGPAMADLREGSLGKRNIVF